MTEEEIVEKIRQLRETHITMLKSFEKVGYTAATGIEHARSDNYQHIERLQNSSETLPFLVRVKKKHRSKNPYTHSG